MKKELVCIACPVGCRLTVTAEGDTVTVEGNACKRGVDYGRTETLHPTRVVTSSVALLGGGEPLVPVRTERPVPKGMVGGVLDAIRALRVQAPVALGQTLLENIAGTGVGLVATRGVGVAAR